MWKRETEQHAPILEFGEQGGCRAYPSDALVVVQIFEGVREYVPALGVPLPSIARAAQIGTCLFG